MTVNEYRYAFIVGRKQYVYRMHKEFFKPLPVDTYYDECADKTIANYKDMYEKERHQYACRNLELSFEDWLYIYRGHTPESFYKNCTDTGMTYKEYSSAYDCLQERYKEHQQNVPLEAQNPFLGG